MLMAAAAGAPGGGSFFERCAAKFSDVALTGDGKVPSVAFLAACSQVVPVLDALGSTAFAPVKSDINGNIARLRVRVDADPGRWATLEGLVDEEIRTGNPKDSKSLALGLLWLKRCAL
jgi:hypothetical protein